MGILTFAMATVDDKILCLHGEPAGTSTTKNGTLWVCQQPSLCHFSCSEAKKHLYNRAVKRFLRTNQARPKCCGIAPDCGASKTGFGRRGPSPERNYAKMKVDTNKERKILVVLILCVQKRMIDAPTFSGEMNVSLKGPYVIMEKRANTIQWKEKVVLTTYEVTSVAQDQKTRTANFLYGWTATYNSAS